MNGKSIIAVLAKYSPLMFALVFILLFVCGLYIFDDAFYAQLVDKHPFEQLFLGGVHGLSLFLCYAGVQMCLGYFFLFERTRKNNEKR